MTVVPRRSVDTMLRPRRTASCCEIDDAGAPIASWSCPTLSGPPRSSSRIWIRIGWPSALKNSALNCRRPSESPRCWLASMPEHYPARNSSATTECCKKPDIFVSLGHAPACRAPRAGRRAAPASPWVMGVRAQQVGRLRRHRDHAALVRGRGRVRQGLRVRSHPTPPDRSPGVGARALSGACGRVAANLPLGARPAPWGDRLGVLVLPASGARAQQVRGPHRTSGPRPSHGRADSATTPAAAWGLGLPLWAPAGHWSIRDACRARRLTREGPMHLARLLEEAQGASPDRRILWRDQIAPYGKRAIEGVEPWMTSGSLAAF